MISLIDILKIFRTNYTPSEKEFQETWKSFWHKSERLPQTQVLGLNEALNDKASKADLANVTTNFKGYHTSLAALQAEYPQAKNKKDFFAWVGSPYPGTVYKVFANGGAWTNTGEVPTQQEIDLAEYAKNVNDSGDKVVYTPDGKQDKTIDFSSEGNIPLLAVKNNASGTLDYNTVTNVNTIKSTGEYLCAYAVLDEGTTGEITIVKYSTQWLVIGKDASGNNHMISLINDAFKCIFKVLPNGTLSTRYNLESIPPIYTPSSKKRVIKNGNVLTIYSYEISGWVAVSVLNASDYGITQAAIGYVHYNNVAWGDSSQFSLAKKGATRSDSWSIVPNSLPLVGTPKKMLCITDEYPYIGQTDEIAIDKVLDFSSTSDTLTPIQPIGNNAGAVTYDVATNRATLVSSGEYFTAYAQLADNVKCQMNIINAKTNWWVIGTDSSGNSYMANLVVKEGGQNVYKVLSNGTLSTKTSITGIGVFESSSPKRYVKKGDSITLSSYEKGVWVVLATLSASAFGITQAAFGNVHYSNSSWGSNTIISLNKVSDGESESKDNWSINPNSIPVTNTGDILVATSEYPYIGKLSGTSGTTKYSKIMLYGDSISSTDYTWYKQYMANLFRCDVYNGGFSGYSTAQLAQDNQLQRIYNYNPDLVVVLVGGNDNGAVGSVGSLDGAIIEGEAIVAETDVNANYNGSKYIQAVSHIMRKLKKQYPNFRILANLTGSESEVEKDEKLSAAKANVVDVVFLTGLPQQRNNATDVFSIRENNERKMQAVIECAKKYNVPFIDSYSLMNIDMGAEPYWKSPTDKVTNNGVWTMDGLHPNRFGYEKLSNIIYQEVQQAVK
ncbi:SGNH/GDSL hydrolase family protein [Dysgonomonas sp.]